MIYRFVVLLAAWAGLLAACSAARELGIRSPQAKSSTLPPLAGAPAVDGDDYYVQFVSEFIGKEGAGEREHCRAFGENYAGGGMTSELVFQVKNERLHFYRETPALAFRSAAGRCNLAMEAKKVYLTPWMRLDMARDAQVDYRYATRSSSGVDLGKIGSDVNAASNVLALTGVGTGVAIMGKLASGWMMSRPAPAQQAPETGKLRQETHTLRPMISQSGNAVTLNEADFNAYESEESRLNPLSSKSESVGELRVYLDVKPSLLLKVASNGVPDARDLSLEELWRAQIQTGSGNASLQQFIIQADHPEHPNLQPDWNNYHEVEQACHKLKVVMKDLGFNKFDRNAVLYYFLDKNPEWKNYNISGKTLSSGEVKLGQLQQYRARDFGGCLIPEDYETMKAMRLAVNSAQDWAAMLQPAQEKDAYLAAIRSLERQLTAAIRAPGAAEMEYQLFPLLSNPKEGGGKVLLQNHWGNFGLEKLLNLPAVPGDGVVVTAGQLAQVFSSLKVTELSCARPTFEQGRLLPNTAILAFATAEGSPLPKGGALEFEFDGGKIVRLAIQSAIFRDFKQDALSHPEMGDCRIDPALLERL